MATYDEFWLVIKDGNHEPAAYFFDMKNLYPDDGSTKVLWDGEETISIKDFWDNGGAISYIEFRSCDANPAPEPATMLLLGSGLVGLAGFRKKFKK